MDESKRELKSYSEAFKQMVMGEILAGLSVLQVSTKYEIGGAMTVYKWCKKYQVNPTKRVTVDVPLCHKKGDTMAEIKTNKASSETDANKIKLLEYELALYKKMVEIAKRDYNLDLIKKSGTKQSKK